jgi:hypothetical protein
MTTPARQREGRGADDAAQPPRVGADESRP